MHLFLAATGLALVLFGGYAAPAAAQPCCAATGSGDIFAVGPERLASFTAELTWEHGVGSYDRDAKYHPFDGVSADDVILALGGGIRPLGPLSLWQIYGSVPLRHQRRKLRGLDGAQATGVGDVTAVARFSPLADFQLGLDRRPKTWIPDLHLQAGVILPAGRSPHDSREPTGVDIMGAGAWGATAGANVRKFLAMSFALGAGVQYDRHFETRIGAAAAERFRPGDVLTYSASAQWTPAHDWNAQAFASLRQAFAPELDREPVKDAASWRPRFGLGVTRVLVTAKWEAALRLTLDPWWDGAAYNVPFAGSSVSAAGRRQF
ncbi:hypothetical protein K8I61_08435 [bacterium]|nr:hypothetical protein [bacterium]